MSETCTADDCSRAVQARGLCSTHYSRARRAGMPALPPATLEERFWAKVNKTDSCWIWNGARHPWGYGQIRVANRVEGAHRVAYELLRGPIPDGLSVDHLCRNTSCVNPDHLEPVTQKENVLRGISPMAQQARMTLCRKGLHPLSGPNLYVNAGHRRCRACLRDWQRANNAAKKGRAA